MSSYYRRIRNSWIFASKTNFLLFFTGTSMFGLATSRYFRDSYFDHILVNETLRIVQKNDQLIELIGYPMVLHLNWAARVDVSDTFTHLTFMVKGPKGMVNINAYGEPKNYKEIKSEEQDLYHIPDKTVLKQVYNNNDLKKNIPEDALFWKFNELTVEVSRDYALQLISKDKPYIQKMDKKMSLLEDILIEEKKKENLVEKVRTDQELEELRHLRMRETYGKVGNIRWYMLFFGGIGAMSVYIYLMKYKRKRVDNSEIEFLMQTLVKKSVDVQKIYGDNLRFLNTRRGSIIDDKAEFEQDFIGNKGFGIVKTYGIKEKDNQWKIKEIIVRNKKNKENFIKIL